MNKFRSPCWPQQSVYKREDPFLLWITGHFLYHQIFESFVRVMYNQSIVFSKIWHTLLLSIWFLENHSTSLAAIHLKISCAKIDRHETTAMVLLDLSKAFDIWERGFFNWIKRAWVFILVTFNFFFFFLPFGILSIWRLSISLSNL